MCVYLAVRKLSPAPAITAPGHKIPTVVLLLASGLVFWTMRVLQEADPLWRLASYGLDGAAVAMTLLTVYLAQGSRRLQHFAFPIVFFLVAVPWPTLVEGFVIQNLTRFNAGLVVEVLDLAGIRRCCTAT